MKLIDIANSRFGRLVVKSRVFREGSKSAYWLCVCDCGNETEVDGCALRDGSTRSCGCLAKDLLITHGKTKSIEYRTWANIKARCYNKNNTCFKNYGGRGIAVCNRWKNSFEKFLSDMGQRPSPEHSIDRIDNDGNYEPSNCRWATRTEQANNCRSNTFYELDGESLTLAQWGKKLNINDGTLRNRVYKYGWSIKRALAKVV